MQEALSVHIYHLENIYMSMDELAEMCSNQFRDFTHLIYLQVLSTHLHVEFALSNLHYPLVYSKVDLGYFRLLASTI